MVVDQTHRVNSGATPRAVRVALVDDERMVLQGLRAWLMTQSAEVTVVAAVTSWHQLLTHPQFPVDVVMLDLFLKDNLPVEVKLATLRAAGSAEALDATSTHPVFGTFNWQGWTVFSHHVHTHDHIGQLTNIVGALRPA